MITHVVAWSFKPEVPDAERRAINAGLADGRTIREARSFALGPNTSERASAFTHLYVATFDDPESLAAFQRDPIHMPLSPRLVDATDQLLVLDLDGAQQDAVPTPFAGLRHVVAWAFRDGTSDADRQATLDGLNGTRVVRPTRSLAAGPNVGLSARSLGHTHLQLSTYDDRDGLEEFRRDEALHAPAGKRLRQHAAFVTALDVEG